MYNSWLAFSRILLENMERLGVERMATGVFFIGGRGSWSFWQAFHGKRWNVIYLYWIVASITTVGVYYV